MYPALFILERQCPPNTKREVHIHERVGSQDTMLGWGQWVVGLALEGLCQELSSLG